MICVQPATIAENLESISFLLISLSSLIVYSCQTHHLYAILKRSPHPSQLEFQARFLRKSNCERAACRFQYLLRQLLKVRYSYNS